MSRAEKDEYNRKRREYYANSEKFRQVCRRKLQKRRAHQTIDLSAEEWEDLLEYYNYSCAYCGKPQSRLRHRLEQDHIIPLSRGGGMIVNNVVPACKSCNCRKGDRTPEEANMCLLRPHPFLECR